MDASGLVSHSGGEQVTSKWVTEHQKMPGWKPATDGSNNPDPKFSKKVMTPGSNSGMPGANLKYPGK